MVGGLRLWGKEMLRGESDLVALMFDSESNRLVGLLDGIVEVAPYLRLGMRTPLGSSPFSKIRFQF